MVKLVSTARARESMNYGFASEAESSFPNMVHVDLINICNLGCIHCPQANIKEVVEGYKPNQLDFDIFTRIVDEVAANGSTLRITCDGEPFLYRHIGEAISYIKSSGIEFATLTTNGTLLDDKMIDLLLEPSDTRFVIDFSLDALYKETYDSIRRRGNYLAAYAAVMSLLKRRSEYPNLRILVNIIDQDSVSAEELDAFQRFWRPLVDDVVVRTYVDIKGSNEASRMKLSDEQERWPCSLLWNRIAISSFGRVRFCVDDWRELSAFKTFDLRHDTIAQIWQSKEYRHIRETHLDGEFDSIPICSMCHDWFGLKWGYDYRTVMQRLFANPSAQPEQVEDPA